jgi:predicted CXXCH cytochrome family protein
MHRGRIDDGAHMGLRVAVLVAHCRTGWILRWDIVCPHMLMLTISMKISCATPRRSTTPLSRSMQHMVPLLVGVNCIVVVMFLMIGFARLYPLLSMTSALRVYMPCGLGSGGCCDLIPTREWWGWWWQRSGSCHHVPLSQRGCRQCHGSHWATRPSPFTANRRLACSCTMQMTW